ncbi:MAG: nicotinamide riboside transporter PnuC [Prochlorotrichaceae cyanobacterium]
MTGIEVIAVVFGLLCVWLTVRQNIWCWPTGLVQVTLYIVIFYQVKLYSDLILHILYVFLQIYGWYHWLHGSKTRSSLRVSRLGLRSQMGWTIVILLGTGVWGALMANFTDAAVPYGDAFTTVASLVAQWLMARKRLESWLFWIAVDGVAIGIYWYKSLYLTSGLYAVFLVLASLGWLEWRKSLGAREGRS